MVSNGRKEPKGVEGKGGAMSDEQKTISELISGMVQKMIITDIKLDAERPIGVHVLYFQIQREDGQTIGFRWPLKIGSDAKYVASELREMANEIDRISQRNLT